jgi:hypothetical protein
VVDELLVSQLFGELQGRCSDCGELVWLGWIGVVRGRGGAFFFDGDFGGRGFVCWLSFQDRLIGGPGAAQFFEGAAKR